MEHVIGTVIRKQIVQLLLLQQQQAFLGQCASLGVYMVWPKCQVDIKALPGAHS